MSSKFDRAFNKMIQAKGAEIDEKNFEECLEAQFIAAGDTQDIGKENEDNPTYYVNKKWLRNFYKIITNQLHAPNE